MRLLALFPVVFGCAPTNPGSPGITTTTSTLPPCCPDNIYDEQSTGRALFNPALTACPDSAHFICSVREDLVTDPTMILLNGVTVVETGPNGMNSMLTLTCRPSDKMWTAEGVANSPVVTKITCRNDPT